MAENINIGSFDFKSDKMLDSLGKLKTEINLLATSTNTLKKGNKELETSYLENEKALRQLTAAGKQNTDEFKKLQATNDTLKTSITNGNAEISKNEAALKTLRKEYSVTSNTLIAQNKQQQDFTVKSQQATEAMNQEANSVEELRAQNAELLAIRNTLNTSDEKSIELIGELNSKLDENNARIKSNSSVLEKQKMEVGNYASQIKEAIGELGGFGGILGSIDKKLPGLGKGLGAITTGANGATKGFKALTAVPIILMITLIVGLFKYLKDAMTSSESSTDKLSKAFSVFTGIANAFSKIVRPLGEFLVDVLVVGLEAVAVMADKAINALASALEFLGMDSAAASVRGFNEELKTSAINARELVVAEQELRDAQRSSTETVKTYERELDNLNDIIQDSTASIEDQITASNKRKGILAKQLAEELKIAELSLDIAEKRIKAEGDTTANLDAQAEALSKIASIKADYAKKETAIFKETNDLMVRQTEKRKEEAQKQIDIELKKLREMQELMNSEQSFRKKDLSEQLELERENARLSIEILDKELKAKRISREKYQTEVNKINNGIAALEADLAIETAEAVVKETIEANNKKLESGKYFSAQSYQDEIERLTAINQANSDFNRTRLENGALTAKEFDEIEKVRIAEFEQAKKDITTQFDEQNRAEQFELEQIRREEMIEKMIADKEEEYEILKMIREDQYLNDMAALEQEREQGLISQELYNARLAQVQTKFENDLANTKIEIEKKKESAVLGINASAYNQLAEIAGKESNAGKLLSAAATTIKTYEGATAAYANWAAIGGPPLGALGAGLAITAGLQSVSNILATPTPKPEQVKVKGFATGGIIRDGFKIRRSNGDDRLITAKTGETILTRQQTRFIGSDLLSLAGVPGFATGGQVGNSNVTGVTTSAAMATAEFYDRLTETITIATERGTRSGAEQGSSQGIRNLAEDTRIANSVIY